MITDDPLLDFDRYDRQQNADLDKRPLCCFRGDPIQDDFYYEINGEYFCEDCLDMHFRKAVDDLVR